MVETPVGDRHVVAAMQRKRCRHRWRTVAATSSTREHATTGDGLLTGLLVVRSRPAHGPAAFPARRADDAVPQVLVNVRVATRVDVDDAYAVHRSVQAVEAELGDAGRVLVRASGTEPLVRVMVEADTQAVAEAALQRLRSVVEAGIRLANRALESSSMCGIVAVLRRRAPSDSLDLRRPSGRSTTCTSCWVRPRSARQNSLPPQRACERSTTIFCVTTASPHSSLIRSRVPRSTSGWARARSCSEPLKVASTRKASVVRASKN